MQTLLLVLALVEPIVRRRLALVGAGSLARIEGCTVAATLLDVALVVSDDATHWMTNETNDAYSYLREAYVPFDMTTEANMANRNTTALSQYHKTQVKDGSKES